MIDKPIILKLTSENVYCIIIFMIIKNLSNLQSTETLLKLVQTRTRRSLLVNSQPSFWFS